MSEYNFDRTIEKAKALHLKARFCKEGFRADILLGFWVNYVDASPQMKENIAKDEHFHQWADRVANLEYILECQMTDEDKRSYIEDCNAYAGAGPDYKTIFERRLAERRAKMTKA